MGLNIEGGLANGFHFEDGGETWLVVTYSDEMKAGDQFYWHPYSPYAKRKRLETDKWIDIPAESVGLIPLRFWDYPPDSIRRHKDNDPFQVKWGGTNRSMRDR